MNRIVTAAIFLPVLIASILISWLQPLFMLLAAAAIALGLIEFWKLARQRGMKPNREIGLLGAVTIFIVFLFNEPGQDVFSAQIIVLAFITLTIATFSAAMLRGAPFDAIISSCGATLVGVLYVALLGGHLVAFRAGFNQQRSAHLLSFFFLVLMGSDAGAYYI